MHLRTLQIYCAVAHYGSFSRAASSLGLTQSAASQAVLHLEEHLGVQLIDRSTRPLVLTRAGQVYRAGAQKMLHDYQAVEEEVQAMGTKQVGRVTIAAIYSIGLSYLPDATAEFRRLYPEMEVTVEYTKPNRVVELVEGGDVDLGLVSYPEEARSVRSVLWQREPMRVICAPGHPLASRRDVRLADLNGLPMIAFETGLVIRRGIDRHLSQRRVKPRVSMEFDNIDSLIRAVQANEGISIIPEAAVRRETAMGSLCVLSCVDLDLTRPLGIAWRRGGRLGPAALAFAELLLGRPLEDRGQRSPAGKPGAPVGKPASRASARGKVPDAIA